MFATPGVKVVIYNVGIPAPYVVDFYTNVLRNPGGMPSPPSISSSISFRFHDKTRDRFLEMLTEA